MLSRKIQGSIINGRDKLCMAKQNAASGRDLVSARQALASRRL